jgi:DNA-binding CsgD family transcriptional regulator
MLYGALAWDQVRSLFQLLGQVDELLQTGADATPHLIERLSAIVGADAAAVGEMSDFRPAGRGICDRILPTGFKQREAEVIFDVYREQGCRVDPVSRTHMTAHGSDLVVTGTRREAVTAEQWSRSPCAPGQKPFGEALYSTRALDRYHNVHGLLFLRRRGAFDARSKQLVRLFHLEGYPMVEARRLHVAALKTIETLPPRQREALACLLEGHTEKRAAQRLGVSPHTMHNYVKALYVAFGVSSRAELLARCLRR